MEPQNWPVCQPVVTECSELPTNLHATKALTDLPVSVGQKVTMACARKGMFINYLYILHSPLPHIYNTSGIKNGKILQQIMCSFQ